MTNENDFFSILFKDLKELIGHPDTSFLERALTILKGITTDMHSINDDVENTLTSLKELKGNIHSTEANYSKIRTHLRTLLRDSIPEFIKTDKKLNELSIYSTQLYLPLNLAPEVFIEDNMRNLAWIKKALECSKSVCRIHVKNSDKELLGYGTGFIVKGGYLFTCNHVLESPEIAK